MADDDSIIIKKVKKGGHGGHHGGAWKVAYADFVTAMMAFFLLLWLLSTTSPEQRAGLADYFTPTIGLRDAKGIGKKGGLSPNPEGERRTDLSDPGIIAGGLPQGPDPLAPSKKVEDTPRDDSTGQEIKPVKAPNISPSQSDGSGDKGSDADSDEFKRVKDDITNAFEQTPELQEFKDNVVVTHTPEGLKIDMVDSESKAMFAPGSSLMTDSGKHVMEAISNIVSTTTNKVSISGHTDSSYFSAGDDYTSWELSSDRANGARRHLANTGLEMERFSKVEGLADKDLLVPGEPNSPRNRRISLTLMRGSHIKQNEIKPTSRGLLSLPEIPTEETE